MGELCEKEVLPSIAVACVWCVESSSEASVDDEGEELREGCRWRCGGVGEFMVASGTCRHRFSNVAASCKTIAW